MPGSPQSAYATAHISSREFDPSKVLVRGDGLKEAKTNREAEFIIDGSDAGPGKPNCTMMGTKADIPVSLTHMGNNVWKANYTPILQGILFEWYLNYFYGSVWKFGNFYCNIRT